MSDELKNENPFVVTKVLVDGQSNPLEHESSEPSIQEFKGVLSKREVFAKLFSRLFELGHDETCRIVPRFRIVT